MKIEVWSDVVCPWCYIGKRRLEAALKSFDEDVEVIWRSFELDPGAPQSTDKPLNELLARKYRMPVSKAVAVMENVRQTAEDEGLDFRWDTARTGNTFDAHKLLQFASRAGRGGEMKERLLRAYFTDGVAISDREALTELATELGFPADDVAEALASEELGDAVRRDEQEARQIGVTGVPFFFIEEQFGIPGAQSAETLSLLLKQVRERIGADLEEGASCDVSGCD